MALLVAPAAAPARVIQVVTPEDQLAEGPLLAGSRVAWEENRCTSPGACGFEAATRYRIRAAGPGGVRTLSEGRIRSLPGGSNSFFSSVSFELSAQSLRAGPVRVRDAERAGLRGGAHLRRRSRRDAG